MRVWNEDTNLHWPAVGGKFDLAATTDSTLKVGDIITIEGKATLNKDYGSGYFFEVILDDASLK